MRRTLFLFVLLISLLSLTKDARGEGLCAFQDYKSYFCVFDNGIIKELEPRPVKEFRTGTDYVVYVDDADRLKVYWNGSVKTIAEFFDYYLVTETSVVFGIKTKAFQFEMGRTYPLCDWCTAFTSDSLIRLVTQPGSVMKIVQGAQVIELTKGIETTTITSNRIDKNLYAFTDAANYLKVFYRNEVIDLNAKEPGRYLTGSNTLAWTDKFDNVFRVFHKGVVYDIESQLPKNFIVADDIVAYEDANGNFKIFYNGKTQEVSSFMPEYWLAKDNIVLFHLNKRLNAFYMGKIYLLEEYIPGLVKFERNSISWIDQYGKLAFFTKGNLLKNFVHEKINYFTIQRDILLFETGLNTTNIYFGGKIYN
jgi:hypothetical protein